MMTVSSKWKHVFLNLFPWISNAQMKSFFFFFQLASYFLFLASSFPLGTSFSGPV